MRTHNPFRYLAILVMMFLGACQQATPIAPEEIAPTAPEVIAPTAQQEPTEVVPVPVSKGTITITQGADPGTLDPHGSTMTFDENIHGQIYEKLVNFSPDCSEIIPRLATSIKQIDPLTWEIKIREGVKFHNGEVMNVDDVKFSLERLRDISFYKVYSRNILGESEVKIVDPTTIHLITKTQTPLVPNMIARGGFVLQKKYFDEIGEKDLAFKPMGTGPYKFVEWRRDDHITLEAFPDYWGGTPPLEKVIFRPMPEGMARVAALISGEVDLVIGLPLDALEMVENDPNLKVARIDALRVFGIWLNYRNKESPWFHLDDPVFADVRIRRALNYAIDKEAIINALFKGEATLLRGHAMSAGYFGYNGDLEPYPYDPELAKQLLAEAGHPEINVPFTCPNGRYNMDKEICEALVGQLAEVGVNAELTLLEPGQFSAIAAKGESGEMHFSGFLSPPDAFYIYSGMRAPESNYRYSAPNEELDRLAAEAAIELDPNKRLDLYHQVAELEREDPPAIFLWTTNELYAVSNRVQGWVPNIDEHLTLWGVSVKE